ncbi:hypothetical protein CN918_31895 [Priestia megaterium]|nr:hypothetical protein CN918_31895 [Priestia megaterium]
MIDLFVSDHFFKTTALSIIVLNKERKIIKINPSFKKMTGYSEAELIGYEMEKYDSLIKEGVRKENIWNEVQKKGIWEGEYWTKRKNDEPILIRATVIKNIDNGKNGRKSDIEHIFLMKDVTEEESKKRLGTDYQTEDYITGFPNKHAFEEAIQHALDQTARRRTALLFVSADLLNFLHIYKSYGYENAELLLGEVGIRLREYLDERITISRIHSDNFTFFFPNTMDIATIMKKLESIRQSFETKPFLIGDDEVYITINMGISVYPKDADNVRDLFRLANVALQKAEQEGGNNIMLYTPELMSQDREKIKLETDLRKAIENQEFELYYQPQIDVATNDLVGVEALIRWNHPKMGMVSPIKFIPLAEETGLIKPIEEWVLKQACSQNKKWQVKNYKPITMSVNMSSRRFNSSEIVQKVKDVLMSTDLEPQYLELEITESQLMYDAEQEIQTLKSLRALGIKLSIDDFGTGYSSLSYLAKFPIDYIKIDRSFIKDLEDNALNETIVSVIISLAKRLGLQVVAEGVEKSEQLEFLRGEKCEKYQGYYFSPPVPAHKLEDMLEMKK